MVLAGCGRLCSRGRVLSASRNLVRSCAPRACMRACPHQHHGQGTDPHAPTGIRRKPTHEKRPVTVCTCSAAGPKVSPPGRLFLDPKTTKQTPTQPPTLTHQANQQAREAARKKGCKQLTTCHGGPSTTTKPHRTSTEAGRRRRRRAGRWERKRKQTKRKTKTKNKAAGARHMYRLLCCDTQQPCRRSALKSPVFFQRDYQGKDFSPC